MISPDGVQLFSQKNKKKKEMSEQWRGTLPPSGLLDRVYFGNCGATKVGEKKTEGEERRKVRRNNKTEAERRDACHLFRKQ